MKVKPIKKIHVPEQVGMLGVLNDQERYVIDGQTKIHYALNPEFEIESRFETEYERYGLSAIHPSKPWMAIMGKDDLLHVVDLAGNELWAKHGAYIAACWALDGESLYALRRVDSYTVRLIVYDNSGEIAAHKEFEDELYECTAVINCIPGAEEMILQLMVKKYGCMTFFVKLEGDGIAMKQLHECRAYTCISFNEKGSHFLCIDNDKSTIHHFSYPELEEIGEASFDVDDCNLDYTLIYLGDRAVIRYDESFRLLETKTMSIVEDLIIEGHEPVPVHELYRNLKSESVRCDISYLCSAGGYILGYAGRCSGSELVVINKRDIN